MEQRFYIMGMTCSGCQNSVTEQIKALPEVEEVSVTLESGSDCGSFKKGPFFQGNFNFFGT